MRRMIAMWACMLVCLALLSGCTNEKAANSESDLDNCVEIHIDSVGKGDIDISSGDPGIVYDFKDSENADGIVVAPRE